jgi:predicted DCC family thiol-disulfide oxidoreductase YuxK
MTPVDSEPAGASTNVPPAFFLEEGPVLLYDGDCGFCNHSVQWILGHEQRQTLRFAPLESALGRELIRESGVPPITDSLLWIEAMNGRPVARKWSDSVIRVLIYVGGPWSLLAWIRWIPSPARDWAYRSFAKHRRKLISQSCLVPGPETRSRFFLDP